MILKNYIEKKCREMMKLFCKTMGSKLQKMWRTILEFLLEIKGSN
jgi:hypothetical protein